MTVNEVIKHIIPVLEGIKVPMTEVETIGIPVSNVIGDLKQCVAFIDSGEQEAREKAEQEEREKAEQEAGEDGEPEGDPSEDEQEEGAPE